MLEIIENNFTVGFSLFLVNLLVWFLFANWLLEKNEEAKQLKSLRTAHEVTHHGR